MRSRRVMTRTVLGHNVQVGFQIRATGPGRQPSKHRWAIAYFVLEHAPRAQCWSDLVDWVFRYGPLDQDLRDLRPRDLLPWRPVDQGCRDSARECGACYCGRVVSETFAAEQPEHAAQPGIVIVPAQRPEVSRG